MFTPDIPWAEVVPSKAYGHGRPTNWPINAVIQHYTGSLSENGLVSWMSTDDCKVSAHLFIFRKGKTIQMVPFADRAYHAGEKKSKGFWPRGVPQPTNVNNFSIGIENCNAGWLIKSSGSFFLPQKTSMGYGLGPKYAGPEPKLAKDHTGEERWWEPYTDEQVAENIKCLKKIRELYPNLTRADVGFHSDVSPHRKFDPGPLWPHDYVLTEVFGKPETVPAAEVLESEEDLRRAGKMRGDNRQEARFPKLFKNGLSFIGRGQSKS